ncbi:glycosyltransferase family 2 protein [Alkalihalophilus sp. As8PL]|uniref:Glycosyltransferase family 2 protein n=1 Tax=Alkalihalophilus sp. As8PL TaxID=3237103 RepID=A0AB39BUU2_9BACI
MVITLIIILVLLLIWTLINRLFIPNLPQKEEHTDHQPLISVLVPIRNEERNVADLLASLSLLSYPNLEFIFLDDGSTDGTNSLLYQHSKPFKSVKILKGKPLPKGWIGKVHACYQLGREASGDYLAFIDADIRLAPTTLDRTLYLMEDKNVGLITGFPHFPTTSILSKLLVPMQHMIVLLHLPLFIANRTTMPAFTAAHGAFMFFNRQAYDKAGGHEGVKYSLVEDVHLTRAVKNSGYKALLANITTEVQCHMYESNQEVWNGFSKNIFPGIGRSYLLAIILSLFYIFVFITPLPLAVMGIQSMNAVYFLPLLLTFCIRFFIDWSLKQEKWLWVLMPFSAISLLLVLYRSMYLSIKGKGFEWKGRRYL